MTDPIRGAASRPVGFSGAVLAQHIKQRTLGPAATERAQGGATRARKFDVSRNTRAIDEPGVGHGGAEAVVGTSPIEEMNSSRRLRARQIGLRRLKAHERPAAEFANRLSSGRLDS